MVLLDRAHEVNSQVGHDERVVAATLDVSDLLARTVGEKYLSQPGQRRVLRVVLAALAEIIEPHSEELPIFSQDEGVPEPASRLGHLPAPPQQLWLLYFVQSDHILVVVVAVGLNLMRVCLPTPVRFACCCHQN